MRSNQRNEFAGSDDFGLLPEPWEMAWIARHKVIGAGRIRAFHEDIVIGIARNLDLAQSGNQVGAVFNLLKELLPQAFANLEFRTRQDDSIFRENGRRYIQPCGTRHRQQKHGALQSVRLERRGNDDIRVEDQPNR